jgi:HopA1 effector protein family
VRALPEAARWVTLKLASGVGLAEEPNTGESFGMHRCRLVAEGLVDAWKQGAHTLEERIQAVDTKFTSNGLKLDRPYLSPGSVELFDLP